MALTKIPGNLIETGAITGDVLADGGIVQQNRLSLNTED